MELFHGVGRRKKSVSRAWLRAGTGKIDVNGVDYKEYFKTKLNASKIEFPLEKTDSKNSLDIKINVFGGGRTGQTDAAALSISRALLSMDENLREVLRKSGLLTVDSRVKERKKYGQKGARAKFQFVKR